MYKFGTHYYYFLEDGQRKAPLRDGTNGLFHRKIILSFWNRWIIEIDVRNINIIFLKVPEDRNAQFENITSIRSDFESSAEVVISMDIKKRIDR